jgi:hypothetical protein
VRSVLLSEIQSVLSIARRRYGYTLVHHGGKSDQVRAFPGQNGPILMVDEDENADLAFVGSWPNECRRNHRAGSSTVLRCCVRGSCAVKVRLCYSRRVDGRGGY